MRKTMKASTKPAITVFRRLVRMVVIIESPAHESGGKLYYLTRLLHEKHVVLHGEAREFAARRIRGWGYVDAITTTLNATHSDLPARGIIYLSPFWPQAAVRHTPRLAFCGHLSVRASFCGRPPARSCRPRRNNTSHTPADRAAA